MEDGAGAVERARTRGLAEAEQEHEPFGRFALLAGHDMRIPLSTVSAVLTTLQRQHADDLDDDAHHLLTIAERGLERLRRMLDDLLDYAGAGDTIDPGARADLGDVVARAHQCVPSIALEHGPLPEVRGDGALLEHLFLNLLSNAVTHGRPDRAVRVRIDTAREGPGWRIEVQDNGRTIPETSRRRVFEPFERGGDTPRGGSGLGLAIVARIARLHGSRVEAADSPLGGTTIRFWLDA